MSAGCEACTKVHHIIKKELNDNYQFNDIDTILFFIMFTWYNYYLYLNVVNIAAVVLILSSVKTCVKHIILIL